MNCKNSSSEPAYSNIKILDILKDGEYHEFKIIKKCDGYSENQKLSYEKYKRKFDEAYNYYYILQYLGSEPEYHKKFTNTTFYQPITKAISEELENYKDVKDIISDNVLYIIKIACTKEGIYNKYFVEAVSQYNYKKYEAGDTGKKKLVSPDNYIKLFNEFKESLKYIKYTSFNESIKKEFIEVYTPERLKTTEKRIESFINFIKSYKKYNYNLDACRDHNVDISVFDFGGDREVYDTMEDII